VLENEEQIKDKKKTKNNILDEITMAEEMCVDFRATPGESVCSRNSFLLDALS
jgi:hypothetical protein